MVLEYAKSLAGKAKSKVSKTGNYVKNLGSNLRRNSKSELEEVENLANDVYDYENKIDTNMSRISSEFSSKKERAQQKLTSFDYEDFSLDSIAIDDPYVEVEHSKGDIHSPFGATRERIILESNNLEEYVDDLNTEIDKRDQEMRACRNWLDRIENQTVGEMLESPSNKNEPYPIVLAKSAKMKGLLSDRMRRLENERDSLSHELVDTVDEYTDQIYEEAVSIAEDLGGTKRSNDGEFDILRELSGSRGEMVSRNADSINRSQAVQESSEALQTQSQLVNKYMEQLEARREGIETLYNAANNSVDESMLEPVQDRLEAINQGVYDMADIVNDNYYDSVQEAIEDTLRSGMVDMDPGNSNNYGNKLAGGA